MSKILFIIPYIPYPLDSGGNQAFFNMVDYLRSRFSISLLLHPKTGAERKSVEELQSLWPDVEFFLFTEQQFRESLPEVRNPLYYRWLLKAKASIERKMRRQRIAPQKSETDWDLVRANATLRHSVFEHFPAGYADYVSEVSRRGFDIVQVEFYELIALGYLLPHEVETIFVHHELRYVHNENEMALFRQQTPEDRMLYRIALDFERDALLTYRHVIALTEIDRRLLAALLGREDRLYASPAVVRMPVRSGEAFQPSVPCRLTFVGSENHSPNQDAVDWFCRKVAPRLRRSGLDFRFQLVGRWRSPYITEQLHALCPEMELTGYVERLDDCLRGSIALVPIRIGSGMRMKILDAVASGAPVVTTSKGVEGIDLRDGSDCLIADEADRFADAILRLAGDTQLQERLSRQAAERLESLYDPQEMLERREEIYNQILTSTKNSLC